MSHGRGGLPSSSVLSLFVEATKTIDARSLCLYAPTRTRGTGKCQVEICHLWLAASVVPESSSRTTIVVGGKLPPTVRGRSSHHSRLFVPTSMIQIKGSLPFQDQSIHSESPYHIHDSCLRDQPFPPCCVGACTISFPCLHLGIDCCFGRQLL